jgi:hypothetical protein
MSRVNETRDAQRAQEQRRNEKYNREKAKNEKQEFSKLMSQKQEATSKGTQRQEIADGKHAGQQAGAQAKLLARHGISANSFTHQLLKKGQESLAQKQSADVGRKTEMKETKKTGEERSEKAERARVGSQSDKLAAISEDDREGGRGGDMGGRDGGKEGQLGSSLGGTAQAETALHASEAAAAAKAPQLPQHLLQEIVKRVMVGVNEEGLSEMHIEFNSDVLAGSWLKISAKDGKINARFKTDDVNIRRLLKASEGQLARAFGAKGMSLERLEVEGP